MQTVPHTTFWT
jgi:hypothetical protein